MTIRPKVSVIVPAYNAQATLGQAISSILAQTFGDLEVLVVDDGSSDHTWAEALKWQQRDPARVRLLCHPGGANRGVAASRNLALDQAQGEFIAFLDADDAWLVHKLERQLQAFAELPSHVGVVFSNAWNVRAQPGEPCDAAERWLNPLSLELEERFRGEPGSSVEQLLFKPPDQFCNWVMSPTPLVRACHFSDGLRFIGPPRLNTQFEDYLMWLLLAFRCEFVALQDPLAYYRIHGTQFVSRYVKNARCLDYLIATRELIDILLYDCNTEIHRWGWRQRIEQRFIGVSISLLGRYYPSSGSTIRQVTWPDVIPLLRFGRDHNMLLEVMGALASRLRQFLQQRLLHNRISRALKHLKP